MFEVTTREILAKVKNIEPIEYAKTRNFLDGAVTNLSPYISRGVISTSYVFDSLLKRGFQFYQMEKFVQELAWRDYFQNVWIAKGNKIDADLKHLQTDLENTEMPSAIINANTGIQAIDESVKRLYKTGYMHNHLRMYVASIACNVGKSHWKVPAQWMYFHLLDADWASNACSWQWTAGSFSSKKYYANQENINKYCKTNQWNTFLDVDYSEFPELATPEVFRETQVPSLQTVLPEKTEIRIDNSLPTLIYNFYNLDPFWKSDISANRVLLFELTHFEKYPVSRKTIEFVLQLAVNIENIQIYVGEFEELKTEYDLEETYFKEHPTNSHYTGDQAERDWMFPEIKGYFPSFFGYWKECEKVLKSRMKQRTS